MAMELAHQNVGDRQTRSLVVGGSGGRSPSPGSPPGPAPRAVSGNGGSGSGSGSESGCAVGGLSDLNVDVIVSLVDSAASGR